MAITVKEAQTLYVSYFGRPADFVGLQYWTGTETLVGSLEQLAHSFYNSAEGKKYFPVDPATNQIDVTASINAIYANMFARVPDTAGFDYWYNEIASGKINLAEAAVAIYKGAQGKDALMIENKIAAATQFTDQVAASDKPSLYYGEQAFAKANEFLNSVTDVTDVTSAGFAAQVNAAVNVAEAAGAGAVVGEGDTFKLDVDTTPVSDGGTLTNEVNVGFKPEGKYLTAGNDVIELYEWDATKDVIISDIFSNDNDKVSVLADSLSPNATGTGKLKLTAVENLEIISSVPGSVSLNGANFKGLEAIKLIGDDTILNVSDFTYGVKIDATENADSISGGLKADTINGGNGSDTINAGSGNDVLTGGNGADTFIVGSVQSLGIDKILDFSADDKISVEGFAPKDLKKFDASTFSTVNYKSLDAALATFALGGKYQTNAGDAVIFSYDGKTYALLANGPFTEARDALVDITGANVASLTESNFGTNGNLENYAAFKAAVDAGKVTSASPTTIKSITATDAAALLTTDAAYLDKIAAGGIGAVTEGPVTVNMNAITLDTATFASKLAAGVAISAININGTANADTITSSFGGTINGGAGDDTITLSAVATINGGSGNNIINANAGGTINVGDGADTITVSAAATINGGSGDDTINASAATDAVTIDGGAEADSITGGAGNDNITGGAGNDTIIGGAGNDTIFDGSGKDTITGGSGNDTIVLTETSAASDTIVFEKTAIANGVDTITGFKAGSSNGDVLNFKEFLGTTSAGTGAGSGLGTDGSGVAISGASGFDATASGGNVIYVKDATSLAASLSSNNFGSSGAANKIKVDQNTDYVVIVKGASDTSTIYYVEVGTDLANATVTSVGTMNTPTAAFVEGNFA